MPDHYADDIYGDINRKKQLEDAQENKEFDRDIEAYRRGQGNLTDEERLERMKDITAKRKQLKDNLLRIINNPESQTLVKSNLKGTTLRAQKLRNKRIAEGNTGIAPSEVPGKIVDFGKSIAKDPAAMSEQMLDFYTDIQAAGKGAQAGSKLGPVGAGVGAVGAVMLKRIGKEGLENLGQNIIRNIWRKPLLETVGDSTFLSKTDNIGSQPLMSKSLSERMETGYKENIDRIPKKSRATDADFTRSKVDEFARVTKHKIRKYVEKYKGSAVDLERIFKEYTTKHNSALNAKAWLNKYWKDLNKGIGQGGLKNARLKIVDGKLKIVDGRTKRTIEHPFELDHSKAKELMHELGLEGADMSDNLNIVYSEWNRAKNNIGNPAIPDEISEALGQSTTLENFVRRRLDEPFMLAGERVPQRFKEAARIQMLDDAQYLKPNEKLADVIEKRLKVYDDLSNFLVQVDDYIPAKVQRQFDKTRDLNPQEYLQDLKDRGIYDRLTGPLKKLHDKLSDDWINLERGLRSRPTTKYMKPGHDV